MVTKCNNYLLFGKRSLDTNPGFFGLFILPDILKEWTETLKILFFGF